MFTLPATQALHANGPQVGTCLSGEEQRQVIDVETSSPVCGDCATDSPSISIPVTGLPLILPAKGRLTHSTCP